MGLLKTSVWHIQGHSIRAEGEAILIVLGETVVAMFEKRTNIMTVSRKEVSEMVRSIVSNITKDWDTDIEYVDHKDFQALVYNNFRVIV